MSVFDKEAVEAWLNCDGPIESYRDYVGFGIPDVWQQEYEKEYEEEENALRKMGF